MTFYNKDIQYRVTLDTDLNLFVVFDKENSNHVATGVTIEQAVQELKNLHKEWKPSYGRFSFFSLNASTG
ncbi:hypothetical protein O3Q50_03940 [Enterococcus lactis]|nr:hypothetical protein [Enterococcus gallinarum]MCO7396564.1 hypothetical protein [Enterococcus lactis]